MKETEEIDVVQGMHDYVQLYAITEDNANCNELRTWISGYREFKRNAPKRVRTTLDARLL